ncbi:tape measure protein [Arthrobacter sp. SX1312]|uniref:tape measure protein n=1 Tax=Arthrobacter sp. SX1312 TaxID=2058896 RepID=UPI000CE2E6AC|nr:tape measure protein [Arthrobacter sp. SX1312]
MAMVELGTGAINLVSTSKGLGKSVATEFGVIEKEADKSSGRIGSKLFGGLKTTAKVTGAGVAAVLGTALVKGFGRLSAIENAQAKLSGLGNSAEDVKSIMTDAMAAVKGTAFGMDEAATTAAGAVAAGIKPGKDLEGVLRLVGDAATIGGTSMSEMGSIFNKVATSGKVQGDVLAQLGDKGIPIVQLLAEELGVTAEETVKMASDGKINFETFRKAMETGMGGAALKSGNTVSGAFKNMNAALGRFGAALLKDTYPLIGPVFGTLTTWIDKATEKVGPLAAAFSGTLFSSLQSLWGIISRRDFTGPIFGLQEDHAFIGYLFTLRDAAAVTFTELRGGIRAFGAAWHYNDGDITSSGFPGLMERLGYIGRQVFGELRGSVLAFGAAWRYNDGDITSSGLPGFMERVGYGARQIWDSLKLLDFSSFNGFVSSLSGVGGVAGAQLGSIGQSLTTLAPAGREFANQLPAITGGLVKLAAFGLTVVTGALAFLAEHVDTIIRFMPLIVAGFVAWKVASLAAAQGTMGLQAAQLAMTPVITLNNILRLTAIRLEGQQTRALATSTLAQTTNNTTTNAGAITRTRMALSTAAMSLANGGLARSLGLTTIAQRGLNLVMRANPIGLIITAIGLLVAGLVWFFTQTEVGQQIVRAAWAGIQAAVGAVVSWFQTTVLPITQQVFAAIGAAASWLYTNVIRPAFAGIQAAAGWVVGAFRNALAVAQPVFAGIGVVLNSFWMLASKIFQIIVAVVRNILIPAFMAFWRGTIVPVFAAAGAIISSWWARAQAIFGLVVAFVRGTLGAIFTWFRDLIITPVFGFISGLISTQVRGWTVIFQTVVGFFRNTLGPVFSWLYNNAIKPAMDKVGGVVRGVYDRTLKPIFDGIADIIQNKVPLAFKLGVDAAGKWFKGLENLAKSPIRFVVDTVLNKGLIANVNKIADKVKVGRLPDIALPRGFKSGGYTGDLPRGMKAGDVHGREFVFDADATAAAGPKTLAAIAHGLKTHGLKGLAATIGESPQLAVGSSVYGGIPSFSGRDVQAIDGANRVRINGDAASNSHWFLNQAVRMWNGLANLTLIPNGARSGPEPIVGASEGPSLYGNILNGGWAGYYANSGIRFNPAARYMSPIQRRTVAAHEVGHAIGLPHAMATGAYSIMNYDNMFSHNRVTAADAAALRSIYGPPGSGNVATPVGDVDGGGDGKGLLDTILGPFRKIADGLIDSIRSNFPGAGTFVDLAVGAGKEVLTMATKWMSDKIGALKDIASNIWDGAKNILGLGKLAPQSQFPTLYDTGGEVPTNGGRPFLIQNKTRKPELIHTPGQLAARDRFVAAQAQAQAGGGWFEGQLVLDSGELMGTIRGEVRRGINDAASGARYTRVGR